MNWIQRKLFNFFWKRVKKKLPSKEVAAQAVVDVQEFFDEVKKEKEKRYSSKPVNPKFYGTLKIENNGKDNA